MREIRANYGWPVVLLIGANGLILSGGPPLLRYGGALILLLLLPGWAWLGFGSDRLERLILVVGLSLALTIFGAMWAVYLPGPPGMGQLLAVIDGLIVAGFLSRRFFRFAPGPLLPVLPPRFLYSLLLILLLAAALRLPRLGYAEFHEDEAEALMLGVRLFQGEDYALFLHRKGPAQMLVPVAFWLLSGRITETMARFPFALSSLLSVAVLFMMGRRWFGPAAGLVAALLWAINGYSLAFGRMVQYQALIFFMGPLALYCFYLAWESYRPRWQMAGTVLLAACLLAHFDVLLWLPVAFYLGWLNLRRTPKATGAAWLLWAVLLASFYIPYLLDPEFGHTAAYLAGSRIKPGWLYDNLPLLQRLDQAYSSRFYLPLVAAGVIGFVAGRSWRLPHRRGWLIAGLGLLALSTAWLPDWWRTGDLSLAGLPWLGLGVACFYLWPDPQNRAAWLMFGAAFGGYLFLVDDPRTHLYIIYPGAVTLAGAGWAALDERTAFRRGAAAVVTLLAGAVIIYEGLIFLPTESAFSRLRAGWEDSAAELLYDDLPKAGQYFGYPSRTGWKAIGTLRAEGRFPGDFRSANVDFIIPIWYNFGEARSCYETPAYFFVRDEAGPPQPYTEVGRVEREGTVTIHVYGDEATGPEPPPLYSLAELAPRFDRLASPERFAHQAEPSRRLEAQFGPAIRLTGYDLPRQQLAPGDTLRLNLYWRAVQNPGDRYRVFVHLTDGETLWSQQDDDPACRLPTSIWRAGQRGRGQFRLPLSPDMPPGRYALVIGLYRADSLERLAISAGAGQIGDDFLWLADIEVVEEAAD